MRQPPPTTFMFYVYVLKSKRDNKAYIGYSSDLRRRLKEHNQGFSKATEKRRPFILVYYEAYHAKSDARRRELKLKKFKNSYKELKKRLVDSLEEL